ncbi:hypothetical protein NUSPORA_01879 [Nucleospora cyclopteri]
MFFLILKNTILTAENNKIPEIENEVVTCDEDFEMRLEFNCKYTALCKDITSFFKEIFNELTTNLVTELKNKDKQYNELFEILLTDMDLSSNFKETVYNELSETPFKLQEHLKTLSDSLKEQHDFIISSNQKIITTSIIQISRFRKEYIQQLNSTCKWMNDYRQKIISAKYNESQKMVLKNQNTKECEKSKSTENIKILSFNLKENLKLISAKPEAERKSHKDNETGAKPKKATRKI